MARHPPPYTINCIQWPKFMALLNVASVVDISVTRRVVEKNCKRSVVNMLSPAHQCRLHAQLKIPGDCMLHVSQPLVDTSHFCPSVPVSHQSAHAVRQPICPSFCKCCALAAGAFDKPQRQSIWPAKPHASCKEVATWATVVLCCCQADIPLSIFELSCWDAEAFLLAITLYQLLYSGPRYGC